jgi:hypothetical protein
LSVPPACLAIVSDKLFQEQPKWIDGILVQNAAEGRALGEPVMIVLARLTQIMLPANPLLPPPEYAATRTRRLRRIAQVSQGRLAAAGCNP